MQQAIPNDLSEIWGLQIFRGELATNESDIVAPVIHLIEKGTSMIGRMWRGWTTRENGKAYERVFSTKVLPELNSVEGFEGAYLFRRDVNNGIEFVVLTLFKSIKAVRGFAGEDYELAVISSEAKEVLKNFEEHATHYEIVSRPN
jgi:heme-degrading monooxygenase HmoA